MKAATNLSSGKLALLSVVCIYGAGFLHAGLDKENSTAELLMLLSSWLLASVIALWMVGDTQRRGQPLPYDADSFFYFLWAVALPLYLIRTRGARGCAIALLIVLLLIGSIVIEVMHAGISER